MCVAGSSYSYVYYVLHNIENKMLDSIFSPPAVIRRLNFPSPEGESKATRKQKCKLINAAQTELVSYVYIFYS